MYTFIIFAVCIDDSLEMDATNGGCICAVGYYQTTAVNTDHPPVCAACLPGSTTQTTNSQDISDCGKNARIFLPIDCYYYSLSTEMSHNILDFILSHIYCSY